MQEFVHIVKMRKMLSVPTDILDDPNVSIGAKGLYVLLTHKTENIRSLEELTTFSNNTKEELTKYFEELTEMGYITKNKSGKMDLQFKPISDKSSKKATTEEAQTYANTTQEKKLSIYDKMTNLVNRYDLPTNVKQLLITYFGDRLNKKGRFAEADPLHGQTVLNMIGDLISFHLSEDDMITCIQQSIDKQWFKFVNPNNVVENNMKKMAMFDKHEIHSGSYTMEEKEEIIQRLNKLRDSEDSDEE